MVIYHWFFDLNYFNIEEIPILTSLSWILFQRVIGFLFLFCTGAALYFHKNPKKRFKRFLELGAIALLISFATWLYAGEAFVKFGIIHLIAVSNLLILLFPRSPYNALLGIFIIILGLRPIYTDLPFLFWLGPITKDYVALDHYPLIPWFGAVLIGYSFAPYLQKINLSNTLLEKIGKNSLLIYLIHQPLLIILISLIFGVPIF